MPVKKTDSQVIAKPRSHWPAITSFTSGRTGWKPAPTAKTCYSPGGPWIPAGAGMT